MNADDAQNVNQQLAARVREAEHRAALAERRAADADTLRERLEIVAADARSLKKQLSEVRGRAREADAAVAARTKAEERLAAMTDRRDMLRERVQELSRRVAELEDEVRAVGEDRDRAVVDLDRFKGLRWNRLGIALRRPVDRLRGRR